MLILFFALMFISPACADDNFVYISGTKNELVWGNLDDVEHLPNGNRVAWIYQVNDNPRLAIDTFAFEMVFNCKNQKARILRMKEFSLSLVKKTKPVNSEFVDVQASTYLRFYNLICGNPSADEKLIFSKKNMNELRLFTLEILESIRNSTAPSATDTAADTYRH